MQDAHIPDILSIASSVKAVVIKAFAVGFLAKVLAVLAGNIKVATTAHLVVLAKSFCRLGLLVASIEILLRVVHGLKSTLANARTNQS